MISIDAYRRIFPVNTWIKSSAWQIVVASLISTLLLLIQLGCFYLIMDLLHHQGKLSMASSDVPALIALVGYEPLGFEQPVEGAEEMSVGDKTFSEQGILSAVWYARDKPWDAIFRALYLNVPSMRQTQSALFVLAITLVLSGLLRGLLHARNRIVSFQVAFQIINGWRRTLHRQALRLGQSDLTGSVEQQATKLFTTDLDQLKQGIAESLAAWGRHPITIVTLFVLTLLINWRLSIQTVIPLVGCWLVIRREEKRTDRKKRLALAQAERQMKLFAEGLRKSKLVKGYAMEDFEHERFQKQLEDHEKQSIQQQLGESFSLWLTRLMGLLCVTMVIFLMGVKVLLPDDNPQAMPFSTGLTFLLTFAAMYRPWDELASILRKERDQQKIAVNIFRFLSLMPEVSQAVGAKFLDPLSQGIRFESVSYTITGEEMPLLSPIDLTLKAGQVTAIVAENPLEARAILSMLPRFIEPTTGRVLFDGEDIAWVTLESLRAESAYVGGKDVCFSGSVLENLTCGQSSYSLNEASEAAKLAHAHNFITKLPFGYETPIGEHGERLDAGQLFRLSLARAALRKPALLIIEEPDVRLDEQVKSFIDDAYQRLFQDRTVIILPSRLSTLKRCEQVVFIHKGKVEAIGRHADLIQSSPVYCHWEYLRFNTFSRKSAPASV